LEVQPSRLVKLIDIIVTCRTGTIGKASLIVGLVLLPLSLPGSTGATGKPGVILKIHLPRLEYILIPDTGGVTIQ